MKLLGLIDASQISSQRYELAAKIVWRLDLLRERDPTVPQHINLICYASTYRVNPLCVVCLTCKYDT